MRLAFRLLPRDFLIFGLLSSRLGIVDAASLCSRYSEISLRYACQNGTPIHTECCLTLDLDEPSGEAERKMHHDPVRQKGSTGVYQ